MTGTPGKSAPAREGNPPPVPVRGSVYVHGENLFFPGAEVIRGWFQALKRWLIAKPPALRTLGLTGYYLLCFMVIAPLGMTFFFSFFFVLLVAVPLYGFLRLILVPVRPAFLLGTSGAFSAMIWYAIADSNKQSFGPFTKVWLGVFACVLAIEWVHLFLGKPPSERAS